MAVQQKQFLVPSDQYLKTGVHIGTKFKTKYMSNFIYKTRPDGLSVLNLQKIDERIRIAINFLEQFEPQDIMFVSRRENGWKAIKKIAELIGCKAYPGRYPPGILTNPLLDGFVEPKILFSTDPWPDRNAVEDAVRMSIPVIGLCDTNNQSNNVDLVIPCNNKGKKSLGLIFYIVTKEYMTRKGLLKKEDKFPDISEFTEE
tara:strand:+ start:3936 stop:4538 length:603 start_codon:yes stop_codon:yes gene_type:complete